MAGKQTFKTSAGAIRCLTRLGFTKQVTETVEEVVAEGFIMLDTGNPRDFSIVYVEFENGRWVIEPGDMHLDLATAPLLDVDDPGFCPLPV